MTAVDTNVGNPVEASLVKQGSSQIRLRILNASLLVAAIFTGIVFFSNIITVRQTGDWWTVFVYLPIWAVIISAAFIKSLSYNIRAYSFVISMYIIGLTAMITNGMVGSARSWFIFIPIVAAILLGLRPGIFFLVLSALTWSIYGYLVLSGRIVQSTSEQLFYSSTPGAWITGGAIIIALTSLGAVSVAVLLRSLESRLEQEQLLIDQVEKERASLEITVQERTKDIAHRLTQIRTAAEISRIISAYLDPDQLLAQVGDLVKERFDLYYVGVFLLDEFKEFAVLKAGTGEEGRQMMERGHKLAYGGGSMVGWTCQNQKARIALDTGAEAVRFNNPFLPQTRSELALPLVSGERVLGAISIQSVLPSAFDENDITLLQSIADSVATAIENARLYRQTQTNLEEVRELQRQYMSEGWLQSTNEKLIFEYEESTTSVESDKLREYRIPLYLHGQSIGNLIVESVRPISEQEISLAEDIVNDAALAIENARLLDEIRIRSQQERLVGEISVKAQGSLDLDTVMRTSVQELGKSLNAQRVQIRLIERQADPAQSGYSGEERRS